jgi:cytochrome c5
MRGRRGYPAPVPWPHALSSLVGGALFVGGGLLVSGTGCADQESPADSTGDCSEEERAVNWENWGAGFFASYCRACHSADTSNRRGAPESVNFDTVEQVAAMRAAVESTVLVGASMPPGGGVLAEDLDALEVFLECGL